MRRITVTIESDGREDRASEMADIQRALSNATPSRREEPTTHEEPHRENGRCYCPYCFSGH